MNYKQRKHCVVTWPLRAVEVSPVRSRGEEMGEG